MWIFYVRRLQLIWHNEGEKNKLVSRPYLIANLETNWVNRWAGPSQHSILTINTALYHI